LIVLGIAGLRRLGIDPHRHCEERSDEAIQRSRPMFFWIASFRS
jgi:hypothetical protein